jgi:putative SOS response-associated peptidase YedK
MCNNYQQLKQREEVRRIAKAVRDFGGNQPPLPGIFPDYQAPIVRLEAGERIIANARWGLPSPPFALQGRNSDPGITNVRNTTSGHWKRWLGPANRCLVPFTSFAEPETLPDGKKQNAWFALDESRPLAFFAGVWLPQWKSVRKVKEGETVNDLFAFLTCEPNNEVGAIHPKAMPVILTTPEEWETWLTAPANDALKLQRPLPDGSLKIIPKVDA